MDDRAAARHDLAWNAGGWASSGAAAHPEASGDRWELFDVSRDFSQAHDLAAQHPEKLKELQQLFDAQGGRGLEFLTFSIDREPAKARAYMAENRYTSCQAPSTRPMADEDRPRSSRISPTTGAIAPEVRPKPA